MISNEDIRGRGGNSSLKFVCHNNHEFVITVCMLASLDEISLTNIKCQKCWCLKCKNFHQKCFEKAVEENATIISDFADKS